MHLMYEGKRMKLNAKEWKYETKDTHTHTHTENEAGIPKYFFWNETDFIASIVLDVAKQGKEEKKRKKIIRKPPNPGQKYII